MSFMEMMFSKKINYEVKKQPSLLSLVKNTPEDFKLEAWIENEEIIVKIKRKENS